jgi:PAS domain S-box-containing protein
MNEAIETLKFSLGEGIPGWVLEKGKSLLVNDVQKDSRFLGNHQEIRSEICAPLKTGDKIIGVIDAQSKRLTAFSEDHLRLFEMTGEHLATVIENVRSEERYRAVVESALDGVLVMEGDYRLTYINERLAQLLGYPKEELTGMDFRNYLKEESRQTLIDRHARIQRGEEIPPRFELDILRNDGEFRNVEMSSTLIQDSHGNMNTVAFLKDITEKRKMEEQLLQSEKLRAVGEMAGGVAHDFNNALAIILGNTQLLLLNAQEGESKEILKTIEKVVKESAQTVKRLLEFTRKGIHKDLHPLDLKGVIREAVEGTRPKWKDETKIKGIPVEIILNLEETPPVFGIGSELKEVIINMINNAVEAMPKGGKLEIRTYCKEKKVFTQIMDTGMGMTEEVKKKAFEPFFTTKPFTHSGLGLSVSYGIIKRMGGRIEKDSRVGEGTAFTIILPTES